MEAEAQLQQALERSVALENKDQRIKTLQQLSNTFIIAGDPARAHQYSQQAMELAQASGMENLTTAGLIEIGNAYLIKGSFSDAEKNFTEALRLAQLYKGKYNEARALLSLASLRKQQEDPDAARDFVQRALPFYQQGGYGKQTSQAYAILGHANDETGDYEAARLAFEQGLQAAQRVGDMRSIAQAQEGLGIVFLHTQRFPDALSHLEEDYKSANTVNAKLIAGYANHFRSWVMWQLGRYEEAHKALAEALAIAEPPGRDPIKDLLADALASAAGSALSENKFQDAKTKAQRALDLAGSQYKATAVRAGYTLGIAQAFSGQVALGRKHCEEAVILARSMRDPLPLSEALLALSEVALAAGDVQAAAANGAEAGQRFAAGKQHEFEWRAHLVEARAREKAGDKSRARELATQANTILVALEQEWGSDNYKTYLTRPDIMERRMKLTSLLDGGGA